ncbi:MAG: nucleoside-diphosphate kinase [Candidatus Hydrogenedentota bacterium]|nr:MAG: nucleoside-diphosphate kinase [Candidatus Hydrogenedentota bacterium]
MERTLVIIKPDAFLRNLTGKILARFEEAGMRIRAARVVRLTPETAGLFYEVHKERPFYASLCAYMSSGPCFPLVLEGENAISRVREIMGATDPAEAAPGTIRADFAESKERNSVHGSDSPESAAKEIPFFFADLEVAVTAR